LETVLLQLLRGSGPAGLAAMPAIAPFASGWLVRPLLSRTRAELEAWVRARGLTWIEDETNADERLDRNYLRHRVLPLIRARWPGSAVAVTRSARHAAEAQRLLDLLARADVERASDGDSLSVKALRALAADRRRNALRFWIAGSGRLVPETRRLEEIAGPLLDARADANPRVAWGRVVVQRHADLLSIGTRERDVSAAEPAAASPPPEIPWPWQTASSCDLPRRLGRLQLKSDERGPLDLDALPEVLTIRWRRGGERLRPRRGGPRRALKSLLQEAHVSVAQRARLPLLFSGEQLIAVADLWLDASVQATAAAPRRARLLWTN
ncbi:MAG: tRNA(Ile)-lysidine synthetase, partial [Gammaproteobacteria bacterium]